MSGRLTKSAFKRALECPRKLLYARNPRKYPVNAKENAFLESLAIGGVQVS